MAAGDRQSAGTSQPASPSAGQRTAPRARAGPEEGSGPARDRGKSTPQGAARACSSRAARARARPGTAPPPAGRPAPSSTRGAQTGGDPDDAAQQPYGPGRDALRRFRRKRPGPRARSEASTGAAPARADPEKGCPRSRRAVPTRRGRWRLEGSSPPVRPVRPAAASQTRPDAGGSRTETHKKWHTARKTFQNGSPATCRRVASAAGGKGGGQARRRREISPGKDSAEREIRLQDLTGVPRVWQPRDQRLQFSGDSNFRRRLSASATPPGTARRGAGGGREGRLGQTRPTNASVPSKPETHHENASVQKDPCKAHRSETYVERIPRISPPSRRTAAFSAPPRVAPRAAPRLAPLRPLATHPPPLPHPAPALTPPPLPHPAPASLTPPPLPRASPLASPRNASGCQLGSGTSRARARPSPCRPEMARREACPNKQPRRAALRSNLTLARGWRAGRSVAIPNSARRRLERARDAVLPPSLFCCRAHARRVGRAPATCRRKLRGDTPRPTKGAFRRV